MGGHLPASGGAQRLIKQYWNVMAIRVEIIQYDDVPADGVIDEAALVPIDGSTIVSPPDGG